ncbi:MAG TPA: hypothetical protein VFU90_08575 [Candidatus Tumulicola sp.]|nr:hypothetical protein [Candidatus Tumulicola sp.]
MQTGTLAYTLLVLAAFVAVAFLVVPGLILELVGRTHDVVLIRKTYALASFHGRVGGPFSILILLFGLWAAVANGIPLGTTWLVISYVLYAILAGTGFGYHMRRELRIAGLSQTSPDSAPSPELAAAIDDPLATPMLWVSGILWIALIVVMILRPG